MPIRGLLQALRMVGLPVFLSTPCCRFKLPNAIAESRAVRPAFLWLCLYLISLRFDDEHVPS